MKITTANLDAVRSLLLKSSEQLTTAAKEAAAAEESRMVLDGRVRMLQGAFDICAASYAQDAELSESQLDSLPAAVQNALAYAPTPAV